MSEKIIEKSACIDTLGPVRLTIEPKLHKMGGMTVRRALPAARQRMVGPFIFFDHMGPVVFPPGEGIAVKPHPHIGLATLTYLFEGEIVHRDSLGVVQSIRPGAVNLMTAGRGIVHSERAGDDLQRRSFLHGIQMWMALPQGLEDIEPGFQHYPARALPQIEINGVQIRVIAGAVYGHESPVQTVVDTLCLELQFPTNCAVDLPLSYPERAFYVVEGSVRVGSCTFTAGKMAVLCENEAVSLQALEPSHVIVIGGVDVGQRFIDWNFVSSRKARIEKARKDWHEGNFKCVPGDDESIQLPLR